MTSSTPRRHPRFSAAFGVLGAAALALTLPAGCRNGEPSVFGDVSHPGTTVSLRRDVQPLFTTRCALAGCHAPADAAGGLVLAAGGLYAPGTGIVNVPSSEDPALRRVEPYSAAASYLVQKISGTQSQGGQMPLGDVPLSDAQINTIRRWIDEGALDN